MDITIYSTPTCRQCDMTKRLFTRAGITYQEVDLATNTAALEFVRDDLGHGQAPVVVIDDHDHWSGFQPDQINRIINAAKSH